MSKAFEKVRDGLQRAIEHARGKRRLPTREREVLTIRLTTEGDQWLAESDDPSVATFGDSIEEVLEAMSTMLPAQLATMADLNMAFPNEALRAAAKRYQETLPGPLP